MIHGRDSDLAGALDQRWLDQNQLSGPIPEGISNLEWARSVGSDPNVFDQVPQPSQTKSRQKKEEVGKRSYKALPLTLSRRRERERTGMRGGRGRKGNDLKACFWDENGRNSKFEPEAPIKGVQNGLKSLVSFPFGPFSSHLLHPAPSRWGSALMYQFLAPQ